MFGGDFNLKCVLIEFVIPNLTLEFESMSEVKCTHNGYFVLQKLVLNAFVKAL